MIEQYLSNTNESVIIYILKKKFGSKQGLNSNFGPELFLRVFFLDERGLNNNSGLVL